jgi:hypothetical protein
MASSIPDTPSLHISSPPSLVAIVNPSPQFRTLHTAGQIFIGLPIAAAAAVVDVFHKRPTSSRIIFSVSRSTAVNGSSMSALNRFWDPHVQ